MSISILCTRRECYWDFIGKKGKGSKAHDERLHAFADAIFAGRENAFGESVLIRAWKKYDLIRWPGGRFAGISDKDVVNMTVEEEANDYSEQLSGAGFESNLHGNIDFLQGLIREDREIYENQINKETKLNENINMLR